MKHNQSREFQVVRWGLVLVAGLLFLFGLNLGTHSLNGDRTPASVACSGQMNGADAGSAAANQLKSLRIMLSAYTQEVVEVMQWREQALGSAIFWMQMGLGCLVLLIGLLFYRWRQEIQSLAKFRLGSYVIMALSLILFVAMLVGLLGNFHGQGVVIEGFSAAAKAVTVAESPIPLSDRASVDLFLEGFGEQLRKVRFDFHVASMELVRQSTFKLFGWNQVAGIDLQLASLYRRMALVNSYHAQLAKQARQLQSLCTVDEI